MYTINDNSLDAAKKLDSNDELKEFKSKFCFPEAPGGKPCLYFAGHSLGLRPKQTQEYIQEELDSWARLGVEGHFAAKYPWLPYHENVTPSLAKLVGAKESEVVAMNTLTTNLHLMLVSFYRPSEVGSTKKYKILIENNTFPSDQYAVDSQVRFHGYHPKEAVLELRPSADGKTVEHESLIQQILENKDELALVMLGNCNYLSGQYFDIEAIVKVCRENDIKVGFNLAHGAGNLKLKLNEWGPDFAVWCSYKYLNAGPGGIAAAFVHERHHKDGLLPRFEGWWGTNKKNRFKMERKFEAIESVEAWQLSNPPIFQLASLRSSLDLFDQAGMDRLVAKRDKLTGYAEFLFKQNCSDLLDVVTPPAVEGKQTRGAMLCLKFKQNPKTVADQLSKEGVIVDFREPDIIRLAPAPLYNSFEDVYQVVDLINNLAR